jgi:hypothetical protein
MAAFVGGLRHLGGLRGSLEERHLAAFLAYYFPLVLQRFLSKAAKTAKYP